jgi:proline iminopeptidase
MVGLFPEREPAEFGRLSVGDGQTVYWETVGNPAGVPVVYLHGGPGSGGGPRVRRYFDPGRFRAVLFDQRGCGRSEPLADAPWVDLSVNTTDHLVADIERLREYLDIERWMVFGISWGVTLGLVYAQRHPERVLGMVLGAVTAGRDARLTGSRDRSAACSRANGSSSSPACRPMTEAVTSLALTRGGWPAAIRQSAKMPPDAGVRGRTRMSR